MGNRIHVALNVTDLGAALVFYRALLGAEELKSTDDFAKFVLDEPALNLALNLVPATLPHEAVTSGDSAEFGGPPAPPAGTTPGVLSHLGLQLLGESQVVAYRERWQAAGLNIVIGAGRSGEPKVWAYDPDGNEWEVFSE
jgi:catechol 2,3-dioxygenase-like lactoylglutathione lyase family enzyme